MGIVDPTPEGNPSRSRTSPAPAKRTGRPVKEEHPMFDTLQVTKELRESGLAEPQAEAIVVAFGAIAGNVLTKDDLKGFSTKDDLKDFATEATMFKALGEASDRIHRSLLQYAMVTVMANIAMVVAIFAIAKYLF